MSYIESFTFDELKLGQSASLHRRLTLEDLRTLAKDAAQLNPDHIDQRYAGSDVFQQFIAQGMWGTALVKTLIATELPGPGTRFLEEKLSFGVPLSLGDKVTVRVKIAELRSDRRLALLECHCVNDRGELTVSGTVLVEAPAEKVRRPVETATDAGGGRRRSQLEWLLQQAAGLPAVKTAVVHPTDQVSLVGAVEAAERNLIVPVLVGPEHKIRAVAEQEGLDLSPFEIVSTEHSHAAAEKAVELARGREVECLMKGALHTDEFMHAVVRKDGLRTERRMSHVWVMDVPTYPRPLLITDSALNIYPDLEAKRDIVQNAIELAQALGVELPRVAILSATETVNPKIQSTLDAAALCKMADRGQITGGILDGPLAFDNAISAAAAKTKGIVSAVAGSPDILLAPDLEAGNMLGKQLHYLADADAAGIVLGARVPVVLTSRADDPVSRMASCAIALLLAHHKRKATG